MALLEIQNPSVEFDSTQAPFRAIDSVDLTIEPGEIVGMVGESGSGKSVISLAILGMVGYPGRITADRIAFNGKGLLTLSSRQRRSINGPDIAMIFQEPMTSFNPCYSVGFQIAEVLRVHEGGSRQDRRRRTVSSSTRSEFLTQTLVCSHFHINFRAE